MLTLNELFFQDIHVELEKTHRGEDRYLVLVTQEHQVTFSSFSPLTKTVVLPDRC